MHIVPRLWNGIFIQQIFMEHLLCTKHQTNCNEQECHDSSLCWGTWTSKQADVQGSQAWVKLMAL